MKTWERLSEIFESAERIPIDESSKIIIMSDCHRGDGSQADDFFKNENLYQTALNYYFNQGYTYIELGDGDELWENKEFAGIVDEHLEIFLLLKILHIRR